MPTSATPPEPPGDSKVEDPEGVISEVTGLSRQEVRDTWAEAQENARKLRECEGPHDFKPESDPPMRRVSRYRCTKCGGTVSCSDYRWYMDGLEHGKRLTGSK